MYSVSFLLRGKFSEAWSTLPFAGPGYDQLAERRFEFIP